MQDATRIFLLLLTTGVVLIAIEIFIPGGIVGLLGGLALIGAASIAFFAFGIQGGLIASAGIIALLAIILTLWIKYFPRTRAGRALTLEDSGKSFKITDETLVPLINRKGLAITDLRPAGIAKIAGRRLDVIAEGRWITKDSIVQVIRISGNNVIVQEVKSL